MNSIESEMLAYIKRRIDEGALAVEATEVRKAINPTNSRKLRNKAAYRYGIERLHRRRVINCIDDKDGKLYYFLDPWPSKELLRAMNRRSTRILMKLKSEFPDVAARIEAALVTAGRDDLAAQIGEVEVLRWSFDKDADRSYIYVQSPREINVVETNVIDVKYGEMVVLKGDEDAAVDVDNFGRLTGIELLHFQVSPTANSDDERRTNKP